MSSLDVPLGPLAPRCATHPEEAATGTCSRCGTFFCAGCVRWVFGKAWCSACAARPEVDYLERFRLKLWGRRDASSWVVGAVGLGLGVATVLAVVERRTPWPLALIFSAGTAASIAFFLGWRWAREVLVGTSLGCTQACWVSGSQGFAVLFLFLGAAAIVYYFDTRNRLFFQRPVSAARLQRLWHVRENNPRARDAMNLGLAAFFFPLFAPLAVLVGIVALRRVDPHAIPPIGRKGQALSGIALGLGSLVLWGLLLWSYFARAALDMG
ncbi:MAG: hypothetical protein ACJ8AT_22420 [Hyalangium sp.]|uniref:hypothetical protein n=1 Tax=Hyalangium sp. TaxID=2028555 RepID=UPI00389A75DC